MVRAIPNWAQLTGAVREIRHLDGGRSELVIAIERVDDIPGFPNLLVRFAGNELAVTVRSEALRRAGVRKGDAISVRAQRAGPRAVVAQPGSLVHVG